MADLRQYTELNIYMIEGDTLNSTNATFTDDDATDYSGYDSGTCLIKKNKTDADSVAVIKFSTSPAAGEGTLVLQAGSFYFSALPSISDSKAGTYVYSVKIKEGTAEYTIMAGIWVIDPRQID